MLNVPAIARFDGRALLAVGASFGVGSALFLDVSGLLVGAAVAAAGWLELSGVELHVTGDRSGGSLRMIGAQILVVTTVCIYCAWRAYSFDGIEVARLVMTKTPLGASLAKEGVDAESLLPLLRQASRWVYGGIAGLSFLVQGGLAAVYAVAGRAK